MKKNMAKRTIDIRKLDYKFEFIKASAEELPFKKQHLDTL